MARLSVKVVVALAHNPLLEESYSKRVRKVVKMHQVKASSLNECNYVTIYRKRAGTSFLHAFFVSFPNLMPTSAITSLKTHHFQLI